MSYWTKSKKWITLLFPNYIWNIKTTNKTVYITFDDGPIPGITNWVLEQLDQYNAEATFFCIGNNIQKYPEIFHQIISKNHSVGNHTFNHLNGWKTKSKEYLKNIALCQSIINNQQSTINTLFRPPYGKIKPSQSRKLRKMGFKIIMWDIISYDFDQTISKEKCLDNVLSNIENGSIIVFHDSLKAWKNLEYVLPKVLKHLKEKGFTFKKIN